MKMPRFAFVLPIAAMGAMAPSANFENVKLYTAFVVGDYIEVGNPKVGDDYLLIVEFQQTVDAPWPYDVRFTMAGRDITVTMPPGPPGIQFKMAAFQLPLDDKIPAQVQIDPGSVTGQTAIETLEFTPTPPSKVLEYFNTLDVKGYMEANYELAVTPEKPYSIDLLMGQPFTEGWQKLVSFDTIADYGGQIYYVPPYIMNTNPYLMPVYYRTNSSTLAEKIRFRQDFQLKLSNQRVNPDLMRKVKWSSIDALQGIDVFKHFTTPDDLIQAKHPVIDQFVKDALGGKPKTDFKPYDAARLCFQHVLKHMTYYYPKPGEPDLRPTDAVDAVNKGFGDCGGFSILIVACLRNLGIPARCAVGGWVGKDAGHAWSEMYFPGAGWVVSDGSAGNYYSESGEFAYCFGYLNDLNKRIAFSRGNNLVIGPFKVTWLQGPAWPIVNGAKITSAKVETNAWLTGPG